MKEEPFSSFLEAQGYGYKSLMSRMTKARKAEGLLGKDLDAIVSEDRAMYDALVFLSENEDKSHSVMQNAVRKYYLFVNGREFPKLKDFEREHGI